MSEEISIDFATKMMNCKTEEELSLIRQEIQSMFDKDPVFKKEWGKWLTDIKSSKIWELTGKWPK